MGVSKNEIIEAFARELEAAEEYRKPLQMNEEQYKNLEKGNVSISDESEWKPDMPEPSEPVSEYRYNPEEKPYRGPWHPERRPEHLKRHKEKRNEIPEEKGPEREYSDEEYSKMAKEEPEHVVTNLMLQRKAPYNQFKYIHPLAKSLVRWMSEMNYSPEKGSILYEEAKYMLDIIEQEVERKEREETEESTPTSGETEWKPE